MLSITFFLMLSCTTNQLGDAEDKKYRQDQTEYENVTEECINTYFSNQNVKWDNLRIEAEEIMFLIPSVIKKEGRPNQYCEFLKTVRQNNCVPVNNRTKSLNYRLEKHQIIKERNGFGYPISNCLNKTTQKYKLKIKSNNDKAFADIWNAIQAVEEARAISPALLAAGFEKIFTAENLKKPVYQKMYFLAFFVPSVSYSVNVNK